MSGGRRSGGRRVMASQTEAIWNASDEKRALDARQKRLREAIEMKPSGYTPERIVAARDFDARAQLAPPRAVEVEERRPTRSGAAKKGDR